MTFKDVNWPDDLEYRSDSDRIPLEFYTSVIPVSKSIDIVLGYFSSNAIRVLALGFAQFIHKGGKVRIATNHVLSQADKNLLLSDNLGLIEHLYIESKMQEVADIYQLLQGAEQHFYNCLKYLLVKGRLEIQPVMTADETLSHYKRMLFNDGESSIYASGSTNFTYRGIVENGENLEVSTSWGSK
ncbi:MAG: phospholipase D-like domain-containing protein, partial [Hymenobacteraceae bacterium]|nr:phospholipase D-like domain-containing protein [Hymenobacteraceae bacterium]MDX5512958.1 phospholipase D-like domain-containing protein [Hymenobacteraceae bacterium]